MSDDVRRRDSLMCTEIEVTKPAEEKRREKMLLTHRKKKGGGVLCVILFERNCLLFCSFPVPLFLCFLHWQKSPHKHL